MLRELWLRLFGRFSHAVYAKPDPHRPGAIIYFALPTVRLSDAGRWAVWPVSGEAGVQQFAKARPGLNPAKEPATIEELNEYRHKRGLRLHSL